MIRTLLTAAAVAAILTFAPAANASAPYMIDVGMHTTAGTDDVDFTANGTATFAIGEIVIRCGVNGDGSVDSDPLSSPF